MEARNPYECSHGEALDNLIRAAGRAGTATSGLVIDFAIDSHMRNLSLWKGVVLAKLEAKEPPFKPGDKVVRKTGSKEAETVT